MILDDLMTKTYLAERLFDGEHLYSNAVISFDEDCILELNTSPTALQKQQLREAGLYLSGTITPAFVDLQVNGGGGVLFNNSPTEQALEAINEAHFNAGTGFILPTVITDDIAVMESSADAVAKSIVVNDNLIGIHFEGPHLSVPKKGVHPASHIRKMSDREKALYTRTDLGLKKITVAPESISLADVQFLIENDWLVSIGHTNADANTIDQYVAAGASCFTHLYNAMSPMTGREPGAVGVALTNQDVFAGIILDGHHVDYRNGYLAWRLKNEMTRPGSERLFLVSDAMATSGVFESSEVAGGSKSFSLFGETLTEQNGKLTTKEGTLAGAHLTMLKAVQNVVQHTDIDLPAALKMATSIPASFLNSNRNKFEYKIGYIKPGYKAKLLLLDDDLNIISRFVSN